MKNCNKKREIYCQQIIQMVKNIERCDILIYIYKLVVDIVGDDNEEKNVQR